MRSELATALSKPFGSTHENEAFVIATGLDPRFKLRYFTPETVQLCKSGIIKLIPPASITPTAVEPEITEPPAKRANEEIESFWDSFDLATTSASEISAMNTGTRELNYCYKLFAI
jgi:hypothetical protein